MHTYIVSPVREADIVNLQQAALKLMLERMSYKVTVHSWPCEWVEKPDYRRLVSQTFDDSLRGEVFKMEERCLKGKARMLIDLRRINTQMPESMWHFAKLAAHSSNVVDILISPKDEQLLRSLFEPTYMQMVPVLSSLEQISGYYKRRAANR